MSDQNNENLIELLHQNFERLDQRFDEVVTRFDGTDTRLDRINDTLAGVQSQMAGMTKWSDRFDREHASLLHTQAAQQRAIDALGARVKELEQRKAS
jgi:chromosome segregation ATPase